MTQFLAQLMSLFSKRLYSLLSEIHVAICSLQCGCLLDVLIEAITVRHGSADTVVRAMNDFNGKCYFSGSDSS